MKYLFALILSFLVLASPVSAQTDGGTISYHGEKSRIWGMPRSHAPDAEAGIGQFPDPNFNFITQFSTRFTPLQDGLLTSIDFWVDTIETGISDSLVGYYGPDAAFAWPIPFAHVPETFLKQAVRFTAPAAGRLKTIGIFMGGGSSSSDGFNDTLRVSFLRPVEISNLVVKYGNESATNNPTWVFTTPVGTSRTAYGVRFTTPAVADSFRLNGIEYFVQGINDNTFLPAGDNPANDTLRVRIYSADENQYPGALISETKLLLSQVATRAWNLAGLFEQEVYLPKETDFFALFDLIPVGLPDHIGFGSGASFTTPIRRSILREQAAGDAEPVWRYIEESIAYKDGPAKGAELWMRALFLDPSDATLAENDPQSPNENDPLGAPFNVVLSQLTPNAWNELDVTALGLLVEEHDELWVSTELLPVGTPDEFAMISGFAEPQPRFRSAVYVANNDGGGNWRYFPNTQFGTDYVFRVRSTFSVEDGTTISDEVLLVLYENTVDSLPGIFSHVKYVPLLELQPEAWNTVSVESWNYRMSAGTDFHVAISSEFDANEFSIATDNGTALSGAFRTSVFYPFGDGWKHIGKAHDYAEHNLLMKANWVTPTSLEWDDERADGFVLHGNYPNPFNPATRITFTIPEGTAHAATTGQPEPIRLAVYDVLGRETAVLADGVYAPGTHTVPFNAGNLASGMYLYRLEGYGMVLTGKMSLVK